MKVNHSYCSVPVSACPAARVCCGGGAECWGAGGTAPKGGHNRHICPQGYYPSNKPGVEPKRPCRPINLTHLMYLSSATNRITVTWGNYGKVSGLDPPASAQQPLPSLPSQPGPD